MAVNLDFFAEQLGQVGYEVTGEKKFNFHFEQINPIFQNEAIRTYKDLGGNQPEWPIKQVKAMFLINERLILEIDDHSHFNRYRFNTLRSSIYNNIDGFDKEKYKRYCKMYEKECIKSGLQEGVWATRESILHFGAPSEPGDFFGNGSPGWKWLALEDYALDTFSVLSKFMMLRISYYDNLLVSNQLVRVGKLLENNAGWHQLIKIVIKRLRNIGIG